MQVCWACSRHLIKINILPAFSLFLYMILLQKLNWLVLRLPPHLTSLSFYSLECQVCNWIKDVIIRTQMQSFVIDGQQLEYMKLNFLPNMIINIIFLASFPHCSSTVIINFHQTTMRKNAAVFSESSKGARFSSAGFKCNQSHAFFNSDESFSPNQQFHFRNFNFLVLVNFCLQP